MGGFANWKRKRALRRYASELPRRLAQDYGASAIFTYRQIATTVAKLKLDPNLIAYAYAMFLSESDYNDLLRANPGLLSYNEARSEFARHLPPRQIGSAYFYESGLGAGGASAAFHNPPF